MKKALLFLTLIVGSLYLTCRFIDLHSTPSFLGIAYFGLELFIGLCSVLYWRTLLIGHSHDPSLPALENIDQPVADILIPTFDEDQFILAGTIDAAKKITGRGEIYVLDDGKRDWLKILCAQKGVSYVRRTSDEHAKAGNLNHALTFINLPFALILDADMKPAPGILLTAIPHFEDSTVAIVQFPQEFSNTDSFQHWKKGKLWHDLSFGLITVNTCRNANKAAYWTGSPSIIRVSAIKSIGGVRTGSVTEDLLTTVSLMENGFWVKSLKEIRALGLAPKDYEAFCIQRQRWAKGFFQLWFKKNNPLVQKISFNAKLECVSDFLYQIQMSFYLLAIQVIPVVALFFYEEVRLQNENLVFLWLLSFFLMNLSNHVLGGTLFRGIPFQTYMRLAMFPNVFGFFESLPFFSNEKFEVTPKVKALKLTKRTIVYIGLYMVLLFSSAIGFYTSVILFVDLMNDYNLLFLLGWHACNLTLLSFGMVRILNPKLNSSKDEKVLPAFVIK